jgi:hypothetical protein
VDARDERGHDEDRCSFKKRLLRIFSASQQA